MKHANAIKIFNVYIFYDDYFWGFEGGSGVVGWQKYYVKEGWGE